MPRKQHTEEQIISALKQYEAGDKTADICRKLGVSQATFYMWKKQYAGLGVQELRSTRRQGKPRSLTPAEYMLLLNLLDLGKNFRWKLQVGWTRAVAKGSV